MIVGEGALSWPVTDAGLAALTKISGEQIAAAETLATEWLYGLTGRRFGTRSVMDRPQTVNTPFLFRSIPSYLMSIYGYTRGWPYDTDPRTGQSSARQICELERDAVSITTIVGWPAPRVTDPAWDPSTGVLDPSVYRLEGNYLIRQDGGIWPQTQNLIAQLGQPDTWQITYERGLPPDAWGQRCAGLLALEFGKALIGSTTCKLPANATSATRSGVTVALAVTAQMRQTGIAEVDRWVALMNPQGLISPPAVWSPDVPRNAAPYQGSYAGGSSTVL